MNNVPTPVLSERAETSPAYFFDGLIMLGDSRPIAADGENYGVVGVSGA